MNQRRYERYKNSGVEWLGELPSHWRHQPLKHISTYNDDVLDDRTAPDFEMLYVDISSVSATTGVATKEPLTFSVAPSRARRMVQHGDILVSTVRTYLRAIARVVSPEPNLVVSTGFAVIRPASNVSSSFLGHLLLAGFFVDQVIARSVGVSYPAINASELVGIDVPVPPLAEQEAIAQFLDRETAKIDALIAEQERLIALLGEKRAAVISQAVTKGLDPTVPMKDSGVPWLGEVPAHWEVPALNYRYEVLLGKMLDEKRISGEHLGPYLRNTDVQWGQINTDSLPEMDFHENEYERYSLKKGDLLVCEGGEIGRCAIWNADLEICFYQKALHRIRARDPEEDLTEFLYFSVMASAIGGRFDSGSSKATIAHLPAETLRRYRFAFPPRSEQQMIAEFLRDEFQKTANLISAAESAKFLLQERRTALISAAVTGKIDVRDAAGASA